MHSSVLSFWYHHTQWHDCIMYGYIFRELRKIRYIKYVQFNAPTAGLNEKRCLVYDNTTEYLKNHWTKHRLVCTRFAFPMLIPIMSIKFKNSKIVENLFESRLHTTWRELDTTKTFTFPNAISEWVDWKLSIQGSILFGLDSNITNTQ